MQPAGAATFGPADDALAALPTVYRAGLFDGKSVLVSGAGSGIGKAIAFLFARLGAKLAICGRDAAKLEATEAWLRRLGSPEVLVVPMTIREPEQVGKLMEETWRRLGGLDVLVNNAGGQYPQAAIDLSVKGWNAVVDTNLNGTWYMMQAAARRWRDGGEQGNIVNIVAVYERGLPGIAHSCAARAAVTYLSKTLAVEWAPLGVRVNCVAPGVVESTGFRQYPAEAVRTFGVDSNPMRRAGSVHDVAESVVYLAAPSGKFITGELVLVDGGGVLWGEVWTAGRPEYFRAGGADA